MKYAAPTHGNYEFSFPRITVILGANGSGKSTLLRAIKDAQPSVYVEGGRTITIQDVVQLTSRNFNQYQNLDQTLTQYRNKRKTKLVDRLFDAIMALIQQEQALKDAHSDAVVAWGEGGRTGDIPNRGQPPLERLFEQYNEVFPHIHLAYNKANGHVTVVNDHAAEPYGPSMLSDGEKQVFSLMADMIQIEDEFQVVVVDEPELNLHPELAERLWALLESAYPEKHFIYATHSIQFALRSNVGALYVLSSDPTKISRIENISEMRRVELERFLGGVPGILNADKVVVTEGHEKSFDALFYRWVLDDGTTEVFPCGNCNDVKQVISKQGLWRQISTDIRLTGAIDSDFRSDAEIDRFTETHVVNLPFHEAESFLCLPNLLVAAADKIGSQENPLTVEEVNNKILTHLRDQRLPIALRRCFSTSDLTVRLSLEKSVLATVNSKEAAMVHIRDKSVAEVSKAVQAMDEGVFEKKLDDELADIDRVIAETNVTATLRLVPGKALLAELAPRTGCKNGMDLMRSVKRNLEVDSFPEVKHLSDIIRTSIAQQVVPADPPAEGG